MLIEIELPSHRALNQVDLSGQDGCKVWVWVWLEPSSFLQMQGFARESLKLGPHPGRPREALDPSRHSCLWDWELRRQPGGSAPAGFGSRPARRPRAHSVSGFRDLGFRVWGPGF